VLSRLQKGPGAPRVLTQRADTHSGLPTSSSLKSTEPGERWMDFRNAMFASVAGAGAPTLTQIPMALTPSGFLFVPRPRQGWSGFAPVHTTEISA
jgi:hypothetical protein